ncbi:MAG: type VI secretion system baseplate subunit TssK [Gammaproteobacteria bacterium]|nr:type VI secretion system baseplate subunit TssK [Gammaproteobacteria bacterium]MBT4078766.1 type VI secretion system baseplate subunit TssK [Gammaproteobacteria bacterium]MBT4193568.1 type VI secretion system baseplate subunit TssK [Gammaproteobacteria bacterium]MBT4452308.1 type VI secretion system baseplate subunit TssK [Gammaproteobacteria bacterium]MBT4860687.1 type VI secretion system baseplate subunit TssK [Gammaproteobacteria bacterium]
MENKSVFWHQGLFLQPQHFQLADRSQEARLYPYQNYLQPHFWGVCQIQMLASSLGHRTCEIESGEFIFPDGTFISIPQNSIISPRSFEEEWVDPDKPFTIYLALHKHSQYDDNVSVLADLGSHQDVTTRYVTTTNPENIKDLYAQGPEAQVKFLRYALKIVFDNEKDEMNDYDLIPISQVIRDGDAIIYNQQYLPPSITISSTPELFRIIKEVRDEITGRAMQLSAYKAPVHAKKGFDANLLRYKMALQSLSRFVPRLFHITESGQVHPWDVYGVLRELIGEISTFTDRMTLLGETYEGERLLPGYEHTDLGNCFYSASNIVSQLLNEITIGPQYLVDMKNDGIAFSADVPTQFFTEHVDFYLIVNTESEFESSEKSLLTAAKLCSRDSVEVLQERSLPGVGMMYMASAPPGLPRRPNSYFLRLDIHDDQWSSVVRQENIALLWNEAPEDTKVELVIVRK